MNEQPTSHETASGQHNGKSRAHAGTPEVDLDDTYTQIREARLATGEVAARRTPTGEVISMAERKPAPASDTGSGMSIRLPLESLLKIGGLLIAVIAIVWTLKSDIRDLKTSMDYQTKMQDERSDTLTRQLDNTSRRLELQSFEIQEMKLSLARAGIGTVEIKGDGKP